MIKFGTSGFRGIIGDNFTKENVSRVAAALLQVIKEDKIKSPKIVIGYDNRFMSKEYSQWIGEVVCTEASVEIFTESVPSPTIAWLTKKFNFGVMLTASHNPYIYNGIKIFLHGAKDCDDVFSKRLEKIANELDVNKINYIDYANAIKINKIKETNDYQTYCESILTHFNVSKIEKSNIKVLANCMHGNSVNCLNYLFKRLKLKDYKLQNDNIDPYFEYKLPAPYVYNLTQQAKDIVSGGYDIGFAFDGDSDRFTLISSNGNIYDCNYVISVLYYYLVSERKFKGSVVKNIALSNLVKKVSDKFGYKCYDTKNGFKNIAPYLEGTDAFIGAESNGIAFRDHILSKDGIFVAVAMLELLIVMKKPFHEILNDLQNEFNFKSTNLEFAYPISEGKKEEIINLLFKKKCYPNLKNRVIESINDEEGLKLNYENDYWGMIRFSGCEPVVRIFAEMKDEEECNKLFACYEKFLGISERQ
jgi:phosphomannomutase